MPVINFLPFFLYLLLFPLKFILELCHFLAVIIELLHFFFFFWGFILNSDLLSFVYKFLFFPIT